MKMKFFDLCRKLRMHSDHHQHQMAAVITRGNKLVSTGFNLKKTHPRSPHPFGSTHAEVSALIKANPEELRGASIYVYRQRKDGGLAMARPCKWCMGAIKEAGIKTVYYSSESGFVEESLV